MQNKDNDEELTSALQNIGANTHEIINFLKQSGEHDKLTCNNELFYKELRAAAEDGFSDPEET
ncbi:hypothetical protein [Mesobacillus harenae]|uniref:hypothetical protein n=1 Tax=Mesobacillus harenae TaxID=2213203 RepID=UPI001580A1E2|nr:hypothetical protein [Mesobacillus harenae]